MVETITPLLSRFCITRGGGGYLLPLSKLEPETGKRIDVKAFRSNFTQDLLNLTLGEGFLI
jgi:hypothetical protein